MSRGIFITGTGTEVGKTYVTALIARAIKDSGRSVGVYKPVASGCLDEGGNLVSEDGVDLWEAAGCPGELEKVCPQRFFAPLAPHLAARAEGKSVDPQQLRDGIRYWQERSDVVLVEGAGGLMSPVSDEDFNADLAADFGYPLLVVSVNELGTINATLQTLITASTFRNGLDVAGVVLNSPSSLADDFSTKSNRTQLEEYCMPPILAEVAYRGTFDQKTDWYALAGQEFVGRNER